MINFSNEDGVNIKEEQANMDPYLDEEDMEDVTLNDKREHQWNMVFEDNDEGVGDKKAIIHFKT